MGNSNWEKVEKLVDAVLDQPENQRLAYLEEHCSDPDLKAEVIEMLRSIDDSDGWLENLRGYRQQVFDQHFQVTSSLSSETLIGTQFGSYTIIEKIGEGGMGVIFLAERSDGTFNHRVAIKIIRNGRATEENIQRFKREQQILARLNHPGIAQLYDGGVTEEGFPYIIMEYVDGMPITEYCETHNCTIDKKIELIKMVLEAVQNAHENLTIHRDLKPDNILIDRSGKVKILDFGISKLLEDDDNLMLTQTGSKILTPRYAAPEQIKGTNITTATDMYSLGVVLYKLLTGIDPYDLDNKTRYEVEQTIIHDEPCKPSEAISDLQLKRRLKGDLDAILLKSMRKEHGKRYRVASEFLEDLKHFEIGLPVGAHEGTFTYYTQKFIKRNKVQISSAMAVFLLLITVSVFYTHNITEQKFIAESETRKATIVKDLLLDIFKSNDPILAETSDITLPKLLQNGTDKVISRELDPGIKVEMLLTLSEIYENISQFDQAKELADEGHKVATINFGDRSVETANSLLRIGSIEHNLGNYYEAKSIYQKAEGILKSKLSESDPVFVDLYNYLGETEQLLRNYDASGNYFQRSLNILNAQSEADSSEYIHVLRTVARNHYRSGNNSIGDSLLFKALEISEQINGKEHINTSGVLHDLGLYHMTRAKYEEARTFYNRSLSIKDKVYGEKGHPNHSATILNLAVLEKTHSNFDLADSLLKRSLEMDLTYYGKNHPNIAITKGHLADVHFGLKNYEDSKKYREEALEILLEVYGPGHFSIGTSYHNYGRLLSEMNDTEKAEQYLTRAEDILVDHPNSTDRNLAELYLAIADNEYRQNDPSSSIKYYELAADHFEKLNHPYFKIMSVTSQIKKSRSLITTNQPNEASDIISKVETRIDTTNYMKNDTVLNQLFNKISELL